MTIHFTKFIERPTETTDTVTLVSFVPDAQNTPGQLSFTLANDSSPSPPLPPLTEGLGLELDFASDTSPLTLTFAIGPHWPSSTTCSGRWSNHEGNNGAFSIPGPVTLPFSTNTEISLTVVTDGKRLHTWDPKIKVIRP